MIFDSLSDWYFFFRSIILQNRIAAPVLTAVAAIPGPRIAPGSTLPYCVRYAMMFTGISCREEMFRIRKVHISLLATPRGAAFFFFALRSSSSKARSSIARSPAGVAAQPSPRMFDTQFKVICSFAGWSFGMFGNRKRINGRISLETDRIRPASFAISISPIQSPITPSIVMHSVTASRAESSNASDMAPTFPVRVPHITPINIILPQI